MTNEELMLRLADGDASALEKLCNKNKPLVCSRAVEMAKAFHCLRCKGNGKQSGYTRTLLKDLQSEGMLALIECLRSGEYDREKGMLTTYAIPFIDAAMRRHLERSIGTISLSRDDMAAVRKAQHLFHAEGKAVSDIAAEMDISEKAVRRHIGYATHFRGILDLALDESESEAEIYERLPLGDPSADPARIVYRRIRMEYFRALFDELPKKDRDILGKCYGVFGQKEASLHDIGMYHMMKDDAVEKARKRALEKLIKAYPDSMMHWWSMVNKALEHPRPALDDREIIQQFPLCGTTRSNRMELQSNEKCIDALM